MHIRAMDFEPFAFRINDNALPELIEGYRPEAKKPGRPEEEKFDPYRHITEQQHRIALEAAFGLKEEYGYKDLETALVKAYMSVGVKLNHQKAVSLIIMLRNKRMIVQENGRKYTFKPDFTIRPSNCNHFTLFRQVYILRIKRSGCRECKTASLITVFYIYENKVK